MARRKVVVVGLDGAVPDLVEDMARKGRLPNFARIIDHGVFGKLRSVIPSTSAAAWTSAVTGVNPGKHGVFEFGYYSGYKWKLIDSTWRKVAPIWKILNAWRRKVCIINVPITYPPEKVEGVMVSGVWATLDTEFTYPRELRGELFKRGYQIEPSYERTVSALMDMGKAVYAMAEDTWHVEEKRKETTLELMERVDPDFTMVVFVAPDRLQHFLWSFRDIVEATYEKMDKILGDIVTRMDEDTNLVILSDHGFGELQKCFRLNAFFRELGLFELRNSVPGILRKIGFTEANLFKIARGLIGRRTVGRVAARHNALLRRMLRGLRIYIPRMHLATYEEANWERTKIFSPSPHMIRINLQGREPSGIVAPGDEYERLRDLAIRELLRYVDPETGLKPVKAVYRREEVYKGPYVENLPDLIVDMTDGYRDDQYIDERPLAPASQTFQIGLGLSGRHMMEGVILAMGPDVKIGGRIQGAEILDLTPSVLYLMGISIPTYMDGKVLTHMIREETLSQNPIMYQEIASSKGEAGKAYSEEGEREIMKRLRALGYVS